MINIEQYNIKFFHAINSLAHKNIPLDAFFVICAECMPYLFILLLIYLLFNKQQNKNKISAIFACYAAIAGISLNFIISIFYTHHRPFVDDLGIQLIQHLPDSSFPSDHTTFIFSIAIMLIFFKDTRIIGIIATGFAFLGGIARIVCGVHFPFDIIGSFAVALLISTILFLFRNRSKTFNDHILAQLPHSKKSKK